MHHCAESLGALNLFSCNLMVPSPTGDDGRVMGSGYKKKKSEALLSCPPLTSLCAAWFLTVTDQYSTWPGGCAPLPYTNIGTRSGGCAPLPYTTIGTRPRGLCAPAVHHNLFVHSSFDEHLSCSHLLAFLKSAAQICMYGTCMGINFHFFWVLT